MTEPATSSVKICSPERAVFQEGLGLRSDRLLTEYEMLAQAKMPKSGIIEPRAAYFGKTFQFRTVR